MIARRRISLQLTPLLDLLLIVIFAQYLDVSQRERRTAQAAQGAAAGQQALEDRLSNLQSLYALAQQSLLDAQQRGLQLGEENAALRERGQRADAALDATLGQQRALGSLVSELFRIPSQEIDRLLDPKREPPLADSPEELERLRQRFAAMAEQTPAEMIMHLLTYEEIRKRCDVWDLSIDGQGFATLETGKDTFRFRVEPVEFENRMFSIYKSLPQPKGLVIILYSYDRDTRISLTQALARSLQDLVVRMRQDSGGVSRFEYADLGLRPE